ncbi:MAG: hypothetical protein JXA60_13660 [Candidatus Coatesbacteria bacterium]|nr:hypothetical protein [Candidatus Coatesbacteria bacterium]
MNEFYLFIWIFVISLGLKDDFFKNPVLKSKDDIIIKINHLRNKSKKYKLENHEKLFLTFFEDNTKYRNIEASKHLYLKIPDQGFLLSTNNLAIRQANNVFKKTANKIRKSLSIEIPEGFFYVWFVFDKSNFESFGNFEKDVSGVTLYCRYIVLPYSHLTPGQVMKNISKSTIINQAPLLLEMKNFDYSIFEETFSHELVHVFINSYLNNKVNNLPLWWHESVAIHYSTGSKRFLTREYKMYKEIFNFLEERYGKKELENYIKLSLLNVDAEFPLKTQFNIDDYSSLTMLTEKWFLTKKLIILAIMIMYLLFISSLAGFINPKCGMILLIAAIVETALYLLFMGFVSSFYTQKEILLARIIIILLSLALIYFIPISYLLNIRKSGLLRGKNEKI